MAKTESTAVNELIALVSSQHSGPADAGDDLMFSSPKPMTAARMTAPLPIIKGPAVPPLPRSRAPSGTQSQPLPTIRASTAPPPRGSTIPPLPRSSASESAPKPPQPTQRMNALPPPPGGFRTTQSRPSLPPPLRHSSPRPEGTPAPELFGRSGVSAAMPVAAPFEPLARPKTPTPAPTPALDDNVEPAAAIDDSWFQSSYLVAKIDPKKIDESNGTYQVPRSATTIALIKKLIAPTAILVLVGVCIGGFLAFNGEGGKKHAASAQPTDNKIEPVAKADDVKPEAKPDVAATKPDVPAAKPDVVAKPDVPAAKPDVPAAKREVPALKPEPPAPAKDAPKAVAAVDTHGLTTIKTTRGEVKLAEIRIDSKPAGATVMLVDRGKTSFLGTTPVVASVEPSRAYDVVFTAANHPTQVEHLDPNVTHKMAIVLGKPGNQALAETAQPGIQPQAQVHHHHHDIAKVVAPPAQPAAKEVKLEPKAEPKVEPKVDAPKAAAPAKAAAKIDAPKAAAPTKAEPKVEAKVDAPKTAAPARVAAAPSGTGTLMVSSKPPCEIAIDGKPTGLTTPQRAIQLAPGAHKVTFVNAGESINKTVSVVINADKPTKLIQDLMKK